MTELVGRNDVRVRARASIDRANGVLFVGPAGIGKSALATELGAELAVSGAHLETVQCSAMTTAVPFAPLLHVLPRASGTDPTQMTRALIDTLQGRAADKPLVLVVDDLQHSDPGTAAVVFSLLTQHGAKVIASTRPGDTIAPTVRSLWKDGHLDRMDLEPLTSSAVAELAEQVTGSPLSAVLRTELASRADGNPFYALALTRVGMGSGAIQQAAGVSDLARPLPESAEINDLLQSQLGALDPASFQLVEMIAVGENMPIELFGEFEEHLLIDKLIAAGVVVVDRTTPTHATRCAHPLIGEYLRSRLPPGRAVRIHQSLVDRIAGLQHATPLDLLRAASIAIESEIDVDATLLLDASQVAINVVEFNLAMHAALRAIAVEKSPRGHLLAGIALSMIGETELAHHHLDTAEGLNLTEELQARIAIARSNMAVFFENDPTRSERTLRAAYEQVTSDDLRLEIGAMMIFPLAMGGRNDEAIALGNELLQIRSSDSRHEISVFGMLSMAKFMIASFDDLAEVVARGRSADTGGGAHNLMFTAQINMADAAIHKADADLMGAIELVRSFSDLYVLDPRAGGAGSAWSSILATIQSMTGDLADALAHTAVSIEESKVADDPMGMLPMLEAARAATFAQAGHLNKAAASITVLTDEYAAKHRRAALWKAWADAWIIGQTNSLDGATIAAKRGTWATTNGMNFWSWDVLHTAVRLGHSDLVVDTLEAEAARAPGVLITLLADHARAAVDADIPALRRVARRFASLAAWACCAETHALVTSLTDDPAETAQAHLQGALALRHCPEVQTPLVRQLENPLSEHETDVAIMAANGSTSKVIAEERFVSTRTVDNQLRSVYKKLGLGGRNDLSELLG